MPYINFSEDDLYRANNADLVSYLSGCGGRVKRVGSSYRYIYTDGSGTHDSVTIRDGRWYDHKNQRGGYAVKFLQEFLGFSFQDAVLELLGGHCSAQTVSSAQTAPKAVPQVFELPEPHSDMRRVFAYLAKQRFIDPQIISHFAHERKIYEEKKYHNVVFVGTDENGMAQQASVRSTISFGKTFRMTVTSSDTKYSFSHFGNDGKLPNADGLIVGCVDRAGSVTALVDDADIHTLMIGASGVGKTANFLYPNIEYCCAAGMSFVTTDSKGDLYRNTATIAEKYYGYKISVIDLRNPTRSSGYNMLYLVNKYMDLYKNEGKLEYKAKSEKFAKITAKTIISAGGDVSNMGQNVYHI